MHIVGRPDRRSFAFVESVRPSILIARAAIVVIITPTDFVPPLSITSDCAPSHATVRRCGAFMAKICDVVPQQPKALDRSGDFAKTEYGRASGGQSGVGPTKFST